MAEILLHPGAFYFLDRGYIDVARLRRIDSAGAFFVVRGKREVSFLRVASPPAEKASGVRVDQTIRLVVHLSLQGYPDYLRRIRVFDAEKQQSIVFVTNKFLLDAFTVAEAYRSRWTIELFLKWVRKHLRIKAFYGTSLNAVNTQVWIALAVFVLVEIVKKVLMLDQLLYSILQILSTTLF